MLKLKHAIIGSGAAAVGAAIALLQRGLDVTIIDVGRTLEPENQRRAKRLAETPRSSWLQEDIEATQAPLRSANGIPKKLSFGSDYAYGRDGDELVVEQSCYGGTYSLAQGGLTNVWGSAMLPYRREDILDWPIEGEALDDHYRAVLRHVPIAGSDDYLAPIFPWFTDKHGLLRSGPQADNLAAYVAHHRDALRTRGIYFGASRLAFFSATERSPTGCTDCGLCFYGCPYDVIYSTRFTIQQWIDNGACTYLRGQRLESFEESAFGVMAWIRDVASGELQQMSCEYIYLGAGVLPTAKIVLASTSSFDSVLRAIDSQAFLVPFVTLRSTPGFREAGRHTMAQVFIDDIDDDGIVSHMQLYPYTDTVEHSLSRLLPAGILRSRQVSDQIISRLMIMQGFLHSKYSGFVEISLGRSSRGNVGLKLMGKPAGRAKLRRLMRKLRSAYRQLGGAAIQPAARLFKPAGSHHWGGTFPMSRSPGPLQCDAQGVLRGFERVRIVDSSAFPSIPATTIVLPVMANAHRIASAAC